MDTIVPPKICLYSKFVCCSKGGLITFIGTVFEANKAWSAKWVEISTRFSNLWICEQASLQLTSISQTFFKNSNWFLSNKLKMQLNRTKYLLIFKACHEFDVTKQTFLILLMLQVLQAIVKGFWKISQHVFFKICQKV